MYNIQQILIKYWGYSKFRPLQEDIINSVLNGNDTLALLPTGGGKSICFQVPALAKPGICLVISPLIALIKDQVENLKNKGIPAVGLYSGMHPKEIENVLDNCIYNADKMKFLYISPERLETEIFKNRIRKMPINLMAIDEAHCISQWGYDFRPPYLRIADVRDMIPKVPVLALTATATPDVVEDIQYRLKFKQKNVFQKSFERKNLIYVVAYEEDKQNRLIRTCTKMKGTGIIYARNRKLTKEIATFLQKNKISADYYHAGLDAKTRDKKQSDWINNKTRIIVSTNAFGMGIDKPDVRFVLHIDLPDCLEAYFQEAGRGGRDEKQAYAIIYFSDADILESKKNFENSFPPIAEIKRVYGALGNYFQLSVGSGKDSRFDFNINDFCDHYKMKPIIAFNCLRFLEKEGYIALTEAFENQSKMMFYGTRDDLYRFQVKNAAIDNFIKVILRSYGGLFDNFIPINEAEIAKRANLKLEEVKQMLNYLNNQKIIAYTPQNDLPQIIYNFERLDEKNISIAKEHYEERKEVALKRLESVINYVKNNNKCRSQQLISYFGETNTKRCGNCDVCLGRNKLELSQHEFDLIVETIKPSLKINAHKIDEIVTIAGEQAEEKILKVIQWLLDNEKIYQNAEGLYRWYDRKD